MFSVPPNFDFVIVLEALASRASTFLGQEQLRLLHPKSSLEDIAQQHETVAEALQYNYRLGGITDLRPLVELVRDGNRLEGVQLREAMGSLESITDLKRELLNVGNRLKAIAEQVGDHTRFISRVKDCIDENGLVKDSASPRLREIRRKVNPLREEIQQKLHALMDRNAEAIQDRLITIRRDRFVVPLRTSFQNKFSGIILDQSDSGQTIYMEPASVVPLNNQLASLRLEEEAEVTKILFELSSILATDESLDSTLGAIIQLDIARASAALAEDWGLAKPKLNLEGTYHLKKAWHPLIQGAIRNDISLSPEDRILMLTGPNMGGKTALLKTLGLATVMSVCGLYVACEEADLALPDQLFVDVGDQQSIQENLSTFAGHLANLRSILETATPSSLVLIDELGSGTDPEEGAALSQAFVESLLIKNIRAVITTHLSPLKSFAQDEPGIRNASMRFDVENLRPTYELVVGAPGRSYALAMARRLGFPNFAVRRAEELLGPEGGRLEQLLSQLEDERFKLQKARESAQAEKIILEAKIFEQSKRLGELDLHREARLEEARAEAEAVVLEARNQIKQVKEKSKTEGEGKSIQQLVALRNKYQKPSKEKPTPEGLVIGAKVRVPEYNDTAIIQELRGKDAVIQMGAIRITLPQHKLEALNQPKEKPKGGVSMKAKIAEELNLRGLTIEESVILVDDYLEEAKATGTSPVRLLHGKGTGVLRQAIREALKRDRRVDNFHDAVPYDGGHGVTVVYLK